MQLELWIILILALIIMFLLILLNDMRIRNEADRYNLCGAIVYSRINRQIITCYRIKFGEKVYKEMKKYVEGQMDKGYYDGWAFQGFKVVREKV